MAVVWYSELQSSIQSIIMKVLVLLSILWICNVAKVSGQSYNRACYVNYLVNSKVLNDSYKAYGDNKGVDKNCEDAVTATITWIRASTNNVCINEFLRKKHVSENLIKLYLDPQLKSGKTMIDFGKPFDDFIKKTMSIGVVMCNNQNVFKPDMRALFRQGRLQANSRTKEIECLQKHINNKPLSAECFTTVKKIKDEFYSQAEQKVKKVFSGSNSNLVDLKCVSEKSKQLKLFEKIFYFVVLATTRNMSDKQIDALIKNAENSIEGSATMIFECMA